MVVPVTGVGEATGINRYGHHPVSYEGRAER